MASNRTVHTVSDKALTKRRTNPFMHVERSALRSYRGELLGMLYPVKQEQERLTALLEMVNQAINHHEEDRRCLLYVSDHAVLRYRERYGGVNIHEARADVLQMVEDGRQEVAVRDGTVATVLPEGCSSAESIADEAAGDA